MISRSDAERLFRELLRGGSSSPAFAPTVDVDSVRSQLEPLASEELVVTSTAVNVDRVDIEARAGTDRWRVVYVLDDSGCVTDVHVWRRPPVVEPRPGIAVVINGPSGSGKSSLMRAVVSADPRPWVMFDEPWLGDVRQEYLIWPETAPQLHDGYLRSLATLVDAGNLVLLSAGGHDYGSIATTFAHVATITVGLHCPPDELMRRERGRDGRRGGLAEASLRGPDGWSYDLSFDTAQQTSEEIAMTILDAIDDTTID